MWPLKGGHMVRSSAAKMNRWELFIFAAEFFYTLPGALTERTARLIIGAGR
jgi:hypothetical protein